MRWLLLVALVGCSGLRALPRAGAPIDDETFRQTPPMAAPERAFVPPVPTSFVLPNGLRVLLIERRDLPLVAVQILGPRGTDDVRPRLGNVAMEVLLRGHRDPAGRGTRERLDALAVEASPWGSLDSVGVTLRCTRDALGTGLSVLAEALVQPAVTDADLETVRRELLARLDEETTSLARIESWAIQAALYPPGHPYRAGGGRAEDLRSVTRADVARFFATHLGPSGMTAVVAGDVTRPELERALLAALGGWSGPVISRAPPPAGAPVPSAALEHRGRRVFFVERPGASQTHVAIVAPGIARTSPDHLPLLVLGRILGGTVSSRLGRNLREQKGLTYGAYAWSPMHHGPGEIIAGAAVVRDKTGLAVREMLREIERLSSEPVPPSELSDATLGIAREVPSRFETLAGVLWTYGEIPVHGISVEEIQLRSARLAAVTAADVMRIARTYLARDALRVVVTGDPAVVRADLEALDLGPVTTLDPTK